MHSGTRRLPAPRSYAQPRSQHSHDCDYPFDAFTSLDGDASYGPPGRQTHTLDGRGQVLLYRPTLRTWPTG